MNSLVHCRGRIVAGGANNSSMPSDGVELAQTFEPGGGSIAKVLDEEVLGTILVARRGFG